MAKHNRRDLARHQQGGDAASSSPTAATTKVPTGAQTPPQTVIERAYNLAADNATEEDLEALPAPKSASAGDDTLGELANKAGIAILLLERQKARYEEMLNGLNKERISLGRREDGVESRTAELKALDSTLKEQREGLESEKQQLSKREQALNERQAQVRALEAEAESGFSGRFEGWLRGFDDQRAALRKELDDLRKEMIAERQAWEAVRRRVEDELRNDLDETRRKEKEALSADRQRLEAELSQRNEEYQQERRLFMVEKTAIRSEQRKLAAEREVFAEDQKRLDTKVEHLAASRIETLQCQCIERNQQLQAAREDRDRLVRTLALRQEADLRFGHRSPEEIIETLDTLTRERDDLQHRLAIVPGAQSLDRLRQLEEEREAFQTERVSLLEENRALKARLSKAQIAVTEVESLRDQKAALETSRELLEAALRELRTDVNERIRRSDGRCPFPTSAAMDANEELQTASPTRDSLVDLQRFVEEVRHRIADGRETGKSLYYSERDLRCFLGGLAMSRLHLLQGISGTGKTSLPIAFARAIGAGCKVIEVQAGWRDRQDLLGHFNAFERKFYESEFLLALYRAGCPQFERLPFIVVLDEMNLSHPEQYFADFLSKLEQEPHRRCVELTTEAVDPAPHLFREGRILPLPPNIWFIGTANHDETTKDFAPKTYDRAHVMELPRHPGAFEVRPLPFQEPLSLKALENAFASAHSRFADTASAAYAKLADALGDTLQRRFAVGWGNRLERQIQDYVPVVKASGGSLGEALDHVVATKLIRKIRNRHDNRPAHIKELRDVLRAGLERVDQQWVHDTDPREMRSLAMLDDEYEKLGGDGDE
jgi:hypothetical protein